MEFKVTIVERSRWSWEWVVRDDGYRDPVTGIQLPGRYESGRAMTEARAMERARRYVAAMEREEAMRRRAVSYTLGRSGGGS